MTVGIASNERTNAGPDVPKTGKDNDKFQSDVSQAKYSVPLNDPKNMTMPIFSPNKKTDAKSDLFSLTSNQFSNLKDLNFNRKQDYN
jgi:hypothetical protein